MDKLGYNINMLKHFWIDKTFHFVHYMSIALDIFLLIMIYDDKRIVLSPIKHPNVPSVQ